MVEHLLAKEKVAGSNPVFRSPITRVESDETTDLRVRLLLPARVDPWGAEPLSFPRRSRRGRGGTADAAVLKTAGGQPPCGFESRRPHPEAAVCGDRTKPRGDAVNSDRDGSPKRGLNVRIDPKRCIANAKCTTAAPGIYVLDEETGIAILENEEAATVEQIFAGARACPTQAIIVEQYGRRVFPQILTPMFGARDDNAEGNP